MFLGTQIYLINLRYFCFLRFFIARGMTSVVEDNGHRLSCRNFFFSIYLLLINHSKMSTKLACAALASLLQLRTLPFSVSMDRIDLIRFKKYLENSRMLGMISNHFTICFRKS